VCVCVNVYNYTHRYVFESIYLYIYIRYINTRYKTFNCDDFLVDPIPALVHLHYQSFVGQILFACKHRERERNRGWLRGMRGVRSAQAIYLHKYVCVHT